MRANPTEHHRKTLVLRLSSLGDVILSTSVLSPGVFTGPVDWVVATEFAPILRGHPGIGRLWEFDRKAGLMSWLRLCDELAAQGYEDVFDLHGSLRTRVARLYFFIRRQPVRSWRKLPKARWRLFGYYLFKKAWPLAWGPRPMARRFVEFVIPGQIGNDLHKPDLSHLSKVPANRPAWAIGGAPYFCVMPGSKWEGKCWAASNYLEVCRLARGRTAVILGGPNDLGSHQLVRLLENEGLPHQSGVGKWDLAQVAGVLAGASAYLGNDTGLAHLAEALGVPALIIYGPTSPEMGFGPWRKESRAVGLSNLHCRPCGKDGRRCYRITRKYLCMTGLSATEVSSVFNQMAVTRLGVERTGVDAP